MLFFYNKMSVDQNAPLFPQSSPVLDISRRLSTKTSAHQLSMQNIRKSDMSNGDSILEMMVDDTHGKSKETSDDGSEDDNEDVMAMVP